MGKGNWIAGATQKKKGALHRNLGIPQGQKIPTQDLEADPHDSTTVKREKALARTLGKMRRGR